MKEKTAVEFYDTSDWPRAARRYFRSYGFHFSKEACDYATKALKKENPATKKLEPIEIWTKDQVDDLLKRCNVVLNNNQLYDYVWVANMIRSDYWKSSVADEQHLALMIKDIIDDADQCEGFIFNRWISDRYFNGQYINWDLLAL